MIPDVLMDFALSLSGRGYVGQVARTTPPKLRRMVRRIRAAGMDGAIAIDQGVQDMEMAMQLHGPSPDALATWGLVPDGEVSCILRGSLRRDDGSERPCELETTLLIRDVDPGEWAPGSETPCRIIGDVHYLKWTDDGSEIIEIDVRNMVRKIRGVDQLAERRGNLGIGP